MALHAISTIPPEIWAGIRSHVPHLSNYAFSRAFWKSIPQFVTPEDKHSRLWNLVFSNEEWLSEVVKRGINPVFVGKDLHHLYTNKIDATKSKYLALILGHDGDGGKDFKPEVDDLRGLFFSSLQPHKKVTIKGYPVEYTFPGSGLTINFRDAIYPFHYTDISQPAKLTLRRLQGLYSSYLYWKDDSFIPRDIRPGQIIGMKKRIRISASNVVGLEWDHLPSGKSRQHFFQAPGVESKVCQLDHNEGGKFKVTGWVWK